MAFQPFSPGTGTDHSEIVMVPIGNSLTIAVGEYVQIAKSGGTAGYLTNGTANAAGLGIVVGFCDGSGIPLQPTAYAAGSATGTDVQSVTTASDNQTTFLKWALVEISPFKKFSASVNGTLGTTNNSPTSSTKKVGGWVDVDSANSNYGRVLETTFIRARSAGTVQNFYVWGVDPSDSTRLIVSLASHERIVEQK